MKKIFYLLLMMLLCFGFVACNSPSENSGDSGNNNQGEQGDKDKDPEVKDPDEKDPEVKDPDEKPDKEQTAGIISLDNECNVKLSKTSSEYTYAGYKFSFYDTNESENGYVSLAKGGYIFNTTPFGDIDSFKVEYSLEQPTGTNVQSDYGFGGLYYVTDTHKITSPRSYERFEVSNNELITLEDNPNYIAFYTFNEVDIKSITINYNTEATYVETFENFEVQLIASNDIHGQVNMDATHAGLENVCGYIEEQKETTKYTILLDQGDIYQGSLACYLTQGHIMDDYLLMNGFESTILGNHEWDWMETNIVSHRDYSPEVQLLACNVRYKDGSTPSWVRNYYVTERGGVKFGVIGALGDIAGDISADMIENIMFVTDTEKEKTLTNMISGFADELIEQGCDYIILQIHAGSNFKNGVSDGDNPEYTEVDYSTLAGKLNLVLESHSHRAYYHVDQYGIAHMQCGGYFSALGDLTLQVTYSGNDATISIKDHTLVNANELKKHDSEFFSSVNEWYSANVYKEESERIVCTLGSQIGETQLNQLAADAYYYLGEVIPEIKGYKVSVGGGHINCRSPKVLNNGNVTMSDITNLFPFDNEMYLVKISGRDLKYSFLKSTNYLSGEFDSNSTTNFNTSYYIIIDSYNYFYMTKQQKNPITLEIVVNITELYGIHPREAFAKYMSDTYGIVSLAEITYDLFDYSKDSFEINVNDKINVNVNYQNLADNSSHQQFTVSRNNGELVITCEEGYKITTVEVSQYQNYSNLKFYSDADCQNELTYTPVNGLYSFDNTTNTLVVKNPSNYDVKINYINIIIEEVKK